MARGAAWGLAALVAVAATIGSLALLAERDLWVARERLLAGDSTAASVAAASVRWPAARSRADAGAALARALAGGEAGPAPASELPFYEPEALVASAIARGTLAGGERVAALLCRAGHPLGPLYASALALERGDEPLSRRLVASSPVPPTARGLGARLSRALAARAAGARRLVLDRSGELVGVIDASGVLQPTLEAGPFVSEALSRLGTLDPGALRQDAAGLRLTLDLGLSRLASEALGAEHGSVVLLDPTTGAVLAAVSDPATAHKEPLAAFEQQREPASIAKLLTAAAAYGSGQDADALIARMTCSGVERYDGKPLWCPWPSGRLAGLDHALAVSCNIAFANLGVAVGRERLLQEYRRWGFDAKAPELLGAAGRVESTPQDARQLADLAIGLELTSITPLHAALLAAAVANDGRMPEPALLAGACGPLGLQVTAAPTSRGRVVTEPRVARRLAQAMKAVPLYGTAAGVAPPGLEVAMKTGTASAPGLGYHVNYVGFLPAAHPPLAFCVRVTGYRASPRIHAAAHAVTARLLEALSARPAAPRSPAAPAPTDERPGGVARLEH
ncbi:MAG TPA: penicillin-binding transpeptidase domain-containing protein [Vicinamibacteria bacterium]|nr:penicillin-binding transpeptidase domain-containing protein [Vicinamibacteria bacterium]